jgi:DNA-directed RNA polymerase specialized sigma subunit
MTDMPNGKGTPGDPCGNAVANRVIPAQERLRDMELRLEERTEVMRDVEHFLDGLDALELAVIRLRYFCRMSWPEISDSEHISRATLYRIHDGAFLRLKCETV